MKIIIAAAICLLASGAFAHEAPPKSQPASLAKPAGQQTAAPVVKPTSGHSGGTDAYGCHTNSQTGEYHCHKPK